MSGLVVCWDGNKFAANGRDNIVLPNPNGDPKGIRGLARQHRLNVAKCHNVSYEIVKNAVINIANHHMTANEHFSLFVPYFKYLISAVRLVSNDGFSNNIQNIIDDFKVNLADRGKENTATCTIKNVINMLANNKNNLMYGFRQSNSTIGEHLDFPIDAFQQITLQPYTMWIEEGANHKIHQPATILSFTKQYSDIVSNLIKTNCLSQQLSFSVTNFNGADFVLSSQNFDIEKDIKNNNKLLMTRASDNFALGVLITPGCCHMFKRKYNFTDHSVFAL